MKKVFVDSVVLGDYIFVLKRLKNNKNGNPVFEVSKTPKNGGSGELRKLTTFNISKFIYDWAGEQQWNK